MTTRLSPKMATSFAQLPYLYIRKIPGNDAVTPRDIENDFDVNFSEGVIKGITGGLPFQLLNKTYGFAITARGKSPAFKNHHVIAIRGTKVMVPDWMTNINIGLTVGPNNKDVHAGFMKAFESLKPSFEKYILANQPNHVHCVGHSLGGALATLTASWLKSTYGIPVTIYTFGAPRVGNSAFATHVESFIPSYRVTHGMDPVPWIPLWPFTHAGDEYLLAGNKGARFSVSAHSMAEPTPGYINTAGVYDDYSDIANKLTDLSARQRIKLDYEQRNNARFTAGWAQKIATALTTLLVESGYALSSFAFAAGTCTMTLYDILARTIHKIVEVSKSKAAEVKGLLGHMLVFAGQNQTITEMSVSFIRWVFDVMTKALYKIAGQALQRTA